MKSAIVNMIEKLGDNVSFVELMKIPGFVGEEAIGRPEYNIVFWAGLSVEACQALYDLVAEKVIEIHPSIMLTYITDGATLNLPLAQDLVEYEYTHWYPMVIKKSGEFYRFLTCEEDGVSNG